MSNPIANWWRSQQFNSALKSGDTKKAIQLLQVIQKSGASFSWIEKLFRDKLKIERYSQDYKREIENLTKQITSAPNQTDNITLAPDKKFIKFIYETFNLVQHDEYKLQVTGIDQEIFDGLEASLVEYLQAEFSKFSEQQLAIKLEDALEDINNLKIGQDPNYSFSLTPDVYFMKFFLENVYCVYLAWFLIYQDGLLPTQMKILDIGSGPGTVAYGLALFIKSSLNFFNLPPIHISYYSLEQQDGFQFRGLQFWRRYIESQLTPINTYFRFVTADLFTWNYQAANLPRDFFDFIVISHCFFADRNKRIQIHNIYKEIISKSLTSQGYVLLVIQDKKLFKFYNSQQSDDVEQEKNVVIQFLSDLGLKLVRYKYLTSTDSRINYSASNFAKFARENLPKQLHMNRIIHKYFSQKYDSNYTLDDYVILAQK
ncbi:photosystem II assembly protein [Nodularia spumigena]|uniref:Photosystem II assembly protein n=1 Tax=Nodularia spumigena UHCC 0060 TaxID=3110300 RepID=A0ABU5UTB9_NODSP|nr:photosystem II assembly protein [Nodularia spumigena]MEA5524738.1 photosystem II assembly protein [Nodularia spumigena UHCC 0143]MEA5609123.1 photosystem II assembly protein [Nodularia spumigena UHCC 0060]MEA5613240.1 photosystem II assembly protein [Nodularia spumigena UHCC 0040]